MTRGRETGGERKGLDGEGSTGCSLCTGTFPTRKLDQARGLEESSRCTDRSQFGEKEGAWVEKGCGGGGGGYSWKETKKRQVPIGRT